MLDPLRLALPRHIEDFLSRIATDVRLPALPLHAHEVVFALGLYAFIARSISPPISTYLFPGTYLKLDRRSRINWHVHVVSFVQSCVVNALSLYVIFFDEERKTWRQDENWGMRIWGYTGLSGMLQSFALGYFLWDLYLCVRYVSIFGWGMVLHAIASSAMFTIGFRPFVHFYCPVFLLHELSTPFLNIHWFCDKFDLTGSVYQAVNGAFLVTTFFCCRLVWGTYSAIQVSRDVYRATLTGYMSPQYVQVKVAHLPDPGILEDPWGQTASFIEGQRLPIWLAAMYLTANTALTILNVYWFSKMVQAILKRFDPPFNRERPENNQSKGTKEE